MSSFELELNRRISQLRSTLVTEPPFLPSYLWWAWRLIASFVLPDYLLAEQQRRIQDHEQDERPLIKLLQSVIQQQFRAARLYTGICFAIVVVFSFLFRVFVFGRLLKC